MKNKTGLSFSVMVVFALAAAACSLSLPAQTASIPPTFTPDGSAAQTRAVAPLTLTPSKTPTETKTLYPTITSYPTITPIPTETPIPSVTALGEGRPTPTQQYGCVLVDKYPDQWAEMKAHTPFKARWEVQNTGTKPWFSGSASLQYISGVKMHTGDDRQNMTVETAPGSSSLMIVPMIAPKVKGDYATTWGLVEKGTGTAFCLFTTKIIVK